MHKLTDFLVSSKKILAESGMPKSFWVFVPAPLMPDVAFVELPPINLHEKDT
jgi:hypothetical protein